MAYVLTGDYIRAPLYVVTPIFNQVRYKSRWKHYERFARHVVDSGAVLVTVEAAFGERHHALDAGVSHDGIGFPARAPTFAPDPEHTRTTHPHIYHRVRTSSEIWIKENLINLGVARLPPDWKYVAWVDADVQFARPNWVGETIHQLQHYALVQMFSEAQDVGPRYASLGISRGFGWSHVKGLPMPPKRPGDYTYLPHSYYPGVPGWHSGYAWAARRDAWDALGGLIDFAMMGAADNHMAHALIGEVDRTIHGKLAPRYKEKLREWQFRAERHIRRNVGYVSGLLVHYWHGRKVDRRYRHRWRILTDNHFDPDLDLKPDWQGLLQLVDRGDARSIRLRDQARAYFRARNEDSIELSGKPDET
jgi:hypothetical protein